MSNVIDQTIERHESLISTYDEHDRFHRMADGTWIEWRNRDTRRRSKLIANQAVLFAEKEGF